MYGCHTREAAFAFYSNRRGVKARVKDAGNERVAGCIRIRGGYNNNNNNTVGIYLMILSLRLVGLRFALILIYRFRRPERTDFHTRPTEHSGNGNRGKG